MPFTYNTKESIRENALRGIEELFDSQVAGEPAADPYDFEWAVVQREPLQDAQRRQRFALAVLDGPEEKALGLDVTWPNFSVSLDFSTLMEREEKPSQLLNCILLNIQRRLRSDPRLTNVNGGTPIVITMWEVGNDVNIESYLDREVSGTVFIIVKYKHSENDPRLVAGS
jgi:hypothetical protein